MPVRASSPRSPRSSRTGARGRSSPPTLLASDEGRAATVRSAYAVFLHRAADAVGLAAGVALLKAGATDEQLKASLARIGRVLQRQRRHRRVLSLDPVRRRARPPDRRGGRGRLRAGDRVRRHPPGRRARRPRLRRGEAGSRRERVRAPAAPLGDSGRGAGIPRPPGQRRHGRAADRDDRRVGGIPGRGARLVRDGDDRLGRRLADVDCARLRGQRPRHPHLRGRGELRDHRPSSTTSTARSRSRAPRTSQTPLCQPLPAR